MIWNIILYTGMSSMTAVPERAEGRSGSVPQRLSRLSFPHCAIVHSEKFRTTRYCVLIEARTARHLRLSRLPVFVGESWISPPRHWPDAMPFRAILRSSGSKPNSSGTRSFRIHGRIPQRRRSRAPRKSRLRQAPPPNAVNFIQREAAIFCMDNWIGPR